MCSNYRAVTQSDRLLQYFGEDTSVKPQDFFSRMHGFVCAFQDAVVLEDKTAVAAARAKSKQAKP